MKINILLCDTFPGLLPPYIPSYTSMFVDLFSNVDAGIEYEEFRVFDGVLPRRLSTREIYLITGSNSASYGDAEWIAALRRWVVDAYEQKARLAGICFGHQVIALALGGHVERYQGGWGTGIRASEILDGQLKHTYPHSQGLPETTHMQLLCNHHDQVLRLPHGATPLATSPFCRYEGFRMGNRVVTFQGHPEYTPEYALHLLHNHAAGEDPDVCRRAIESINTMQHDGTTIARFLLNTLSTDSAP